MSYCVSCGDALAPEPAVIARPATYVDALPDTVAPAPPAPTLTIAAGPSPGALVGPTNGHGNGHRTNDAGRLGRARGSATTWLWTAGAALGHAAESTGRSLMADAREAAWPVVHGRAWLRTVPAPLLAGAGLTFATLAELTLVARANWFPLPASVANALRPMWPHPEAAFASILLFLVAMVCFGEGVGRLVPQPAEERFDLPKSILPHPVGLSRILFILSGLVFLWVLLRLAWTDYQPSYPRWFAVALLLFFGGAAALHREWTRRLAGWVRAQPREKHPERFACWVLAHLPDPEAWAVTALMGAFLILNRFDLGSWYYSSLGDEYSFWDGSRQLALGKSVVNLFSQHGVYDIIPWLDSYAEGLLMRVFGLDVIGWKMAVVVIAAAAILLTYLLARTMYGRRVALFSLGFLATAHYLLAYAHTGYPNLEAIFPAVGAFLFFQLGLRRQSWFLLVLGGMFAGLGWYAYYTSRTAIFILLLAIPLLVRRSGWLRAAIPTVGGFLIWFLPLAMVSKGELLTSMLQQTGGGTTTEYASNRALLPIWNAGRSLLAFNYNTHKGPYLDGSLVEPLTALLFLLGLGLAITRWRDGRTRFLLCWFGVGITAVGILSKYDYVSTSRLNYLVPVVAILAALAADRVVELVRRLAGYIAARDRTTAWYPSKLLLPRAGAVVGIALILGATYGNLHRWFAESPYTVPSSPDALAVRVIELPICQHAEMPPLLVDVGIGGGLGPALDAMQNGVVKPDFALYGQPTTWMDTASQRCVLFRNPHDDRAQQLMRQLEQRWPNAHRADETDLSGTITERLYFPSS